MPGIVPHACILRIWELEVGRYRVQDQPRLHIEFKARLDYTARPCFSYVSCCCDKTPFKISLRKERFLLVHGLRVQSIIMGKVKVAWTWASWFCCIISQDEGNKCCFSADFLLFKRSRAQGRKWRFQDSSFQLHPYLTKGIAHRYAQRRVL